MVTAPLLATQVIASPYAQKAHNRATICKDSGLFDQYHGGRELYQFRLRGTKLYFYPWVRNKPWMIEGAKVTLDELISSLKDEEVLNILLFNLDILRELE